MWEKKQCKQVDNAHNKQEHQHNSTSMSFFVDDYGRPFIILKEQDKKSRVKGLEAQKVLHASFYGCN